MDTYSCRSEEVEGGKREDVSALHTVSMSWILLRYMLSRSRSAITSGMVRFTLLASVNHIDRWGGWHSSASDARRKSIG